MIAFGKAVKKYRQNKAISMRSLARQIEVTPMIITRIERDEFIPSIERIKRIAQVLDANVDEMLAFAGKIDPELIEYVSQYPKPIADFLRFAQTQRWQAKEFKDLLRLIGKK